MDKQEPIKYTAADFANARFAEHEDGRLAIRSDPADPGLQWLAGPDKDWLSDYQMSSDGWVPVPTKPTITESHYRFMVEDRGLGFKAGFNDALGEFGIEVIPDPEPTNAEKATADLEAWGVSRGKALELGPWLAGQGWVKVGGDDD